MYVNRRYGVLQTLHWSLGNLVFPGLWAAALTVAHELGGFDWISLPWLPISAIAIAVAFYLGFKNNASYDRLWEARKIYGAIVNASRSWGFGTRDLLGANQKGDEETAGDAVRLVHRHIAWMDALRFQLRELISWEHRGEKLDKARKAMGVPEVHEDLREVLSPNLSGDELDQVLSMINPAAHLLATQSKDLAKLRQQGKLDGFSHIHLQGLLDELMTQQGKAERIKKFPFPRQYATVNSFFAVLFCALMPLGLLEELDALGPGYAWTTIPFSALIGWVFLTMDKIGDWSENPFEGLHNDVPITSLSRIIERDVRQMVGENELPPPREVRDGIMF